MRGAFLGVPLRDTLPNDMLVSGSTQSRCQVLSWKAGLAFIRIRALDLNGSSQVVRGI